MNIVRAAHELDDYRARGFASRMGFGKKPALVVIDLTYGFTDVDLPLGSPSGETIGHVNTVIDAAHSASVPVFFSTISYDAPGLSDAGVWLMKMRGLETLKANSHAVEVDKRLHRRPSDTVLVKRYASCFFGTEFASRLRSQGIDTLVITGCSTSGCVRATAVDACQSGLRTIVVAEAVGDRSEAGHKQSLTDIEAKYGDVVTLSDVTDYFAQVASGIEPPAEQPSESMPMNVDPMDWADQDIGSHVRNVMRKQTSSLAILTARHELERTGIVVSTVITVSLDPPSVLISVNRGSSFHPLVKKSGRFAVNWLGSAHKPLVPIFSGQLKGEARFDHGDWNDAEDLPVLADARAIFVCAVDAEFDYGSHTVFIGKVERVSNADSDPALLWHDGTANATPF